MEKYKQIPYGVTDFDLISKERYYYVDKTNFIPQLENSPRFQFFIRPRRFGKSLLLSILEDYYDVAKKEQFESLFKDTYIGQNPTNERNSYLILKFNFSQVSASIEELKDSFEEHCDECFNLFNNKYESLLGSTYLDRYKKKNKSYDKLEFICNFSKENNHKLYIIVDEYDNFTNIILTTFGKDSYRALTHGEGFFRFFFSKLKGGTTGSNAGISKMFITGVSPITLDDVTSGFNIGWNLTRMAHLNGLVGFTLAEVTEMIEYYQSFNLIPYKTDELLDLMGMWYNNYRFSSDADETMFNSDMVLYFINYIIQTGKIAKDLIDHNVKIDYNKLKHLFILDKKINGNFSTMKAIVENGGITSEIMTSFSIEDLLKKECFVSLMYYFGLLTIGGEEMGLPRLVIPNKTIQFFFATYMRLGYEEAEIYKINRSDFAALMGRMAHFGEWKPVFKFLADAINEQTSSRDFIQGENMIKGFLLAYLNTTNHYTIFPEKEMNKGYADLYLEPFMVQYKDMTCSYIIELKYIPRTEKGVSKPAITKKFKEAKAQLLQYAQDPFVQRTKGTTELKKLVLVWHGWELVRIDEV